MSEQTYSIVRFFKNAPAQIIKTGLSLAEAKAWCSDDSTSGEDWFDGFKAE